jgi:hypothetical protein
MLNEELALQIRSGSPITSGVLDRILKDTTPLELAIFLKEVLNYTAEKIVQAFSEIQVAHKAVVVGGILLNEKVYPKTTKEDMRSMLKKVFAGEDIDQAIEILYPLELEVSASDIWMDTGVYIREDENVEVKYISGTWTINPSEGYSDAEGIPIIAKPGYALRGKKEGCLVGKVGASGEPIYIGLERKGIGENGGNLYLIANDDISQLYGRGYEDNDGSIKVRIKKTLK